MNSFDVGAFAGSILIGSFVFIILCGGLYVWYAVALSQLFPKLGAEGWKGWVPVLNEMVILERGGVPAWNVVFYFIPFVSIYGLYVKAMAMYRIGLSFGRGAGMVFLGILLPPVWASLVGRGEPQPEEHYGERIQGMMGGSAPSFGANGPLAQPPAPIDPPEAQLAPKDDLASSPFAPAAASPFADQPAQLQFAEVTPPPQASSTQLASEAPEIMSNPWAPKPQGGVVETPDLPPVLIPPAPPAPPAFPHVVSPSMPTFSQSNTAEDPYSVAELPTIIPSRNASTAQETDDDDELDRTVVVDRRPIIRWSLITDTGGILPITSNSVLLGRKPTSNDIAVEPLVVPDPSRTLSKNHARLDLQDGTWTLTDLQSTNGVIIVGPGGAEEMLPAGGSAQPTGRFLLGNVGLRLVFEDETFS